MAVCWFVVLWCILLPYTSGLLLHSPSYVPGSVYSYIYSSEAVIHSPDKDEALHQLSSDAKVEVHCLCTSSGITVLELSLASPSVRHKTSTSAHTTSRRTSHSEALHSHGTMLVVLDNQGRVNRWSEKQEVPSDDDGDAAAADYVNYHNLVAMLETAVPVSGSDVGVGQNVTYDDTSNAWSRLETDTLSTFISHYNVISSNNPFLTLRKERTQFRGGAAIRPTWLDDPSAQQSDRLAVSEVVITEGIVSSVRDVENVLVPLPVPKLSSHAGHGSTAEVPQHNRQFPMLHTTVRANLTLTRVSAHPQTNEHVGNCAVFAEQTAPITFDDVMRHLGTAGSRSTPSSPNAGPGATTNPVNDFTNSLHSLVQTRLVSCLTYSTQQQQHRTRSGLRMASMKMVPREMGDPFLEKCLKKEFSESEGDGVGDRASDHDDSDDPLDDSPRTNNSGGEHGLPEGSLLQHVIDFLAPLRQLVENCGSYLSMASGAVDKAQGVAKKWVRVEDDIPGGYEELEAWVRRHLLNLDLKTPSKLLDNVEQILSQVLGETVDELESDYGDSSSSSSEQHWRFDGGVFNMLNRLKKQLKPLVSHVLAATKSAKAAVKLLSDYQTVDSSSQEVHDRYEIFTLIHKINAKDGPMVKLSTALKDMHGYADKLVKHWDDAILSRYDILSAHWNRKIGNQAFLLADPQFDAHLIANENSARLATARLEFAVDVSSLNKNARAIDLVSDNYMDHGGHVTMETPMLTVGSVNVPLSFNPAVTLRQYLKDLATNVVMAFIKSDELTDLFSEVFLDRMLVESVGKWFAANEQDIARTSSHIYSFLELFAHLDRLIVFAVEKSVSTEEERFAVGNLKFSMGFMSYFVQMLFRVDFRPNAACVQRVRSLIGGFIGRDQNEEIKYQAWCRLVLEEYEETHQVTMSFMRGKAEAVGLELESSAIIQVKKELYSRVWFSLGDGDGELNVDELENVGSSPGLRLANLNAEGPYVDETELARTVKLVESLNIWDTKQPMKRKFLDLLEVLKKAKTLLTSSSRLDLKESFAITSRAVKTAEFKTKFASNRKLFAQEIKKEFPGSDSLPMDLLENFDEVLSQAKKIALNFKTLGDSVSEVAENADTSANLLEFLSKSRFFEQTIDVCDELGDSTAELASLMPHLNQTIHNGAEMFKSAGKASDTASLYVECLLPEVLEVVNQIQHLPWDLRGASEQKMEAMVQAVATKRKLLTEGDGSDGFDAGRTCTSLHQDKKIVRTVDYCRHLPESIFTVWKSIASLNRIVNSIIAAKSKPTVKAVVECKSHLDSAIESVEESVVMATDLELPSAEAGEFLLESLHKVESLLDKAVVVAKLFSGNVLMDVGAALMKKSTKTVLGKIKDEMVVNVGNTLNAFTGTSLGSEEKLPRMEKAKEEYDRCVQKMEQVGADDTFCKTAYETARKSAINKESSTASGLAIMTGLGTHLSTLVASQLSEILYSERVKDPDNPLSWSMHKGENNEVDHDDGVVFTGTKSRNQPPSEMNSGSDDALSALQMQLEVHASSRYSHSNALRIHLEASSWAREKCRKGDAKTRMSLKGVQNLLKSIQVGAGAVSEVKDFVTEVVMITFQVTEDEQIGKQIESFGRVVDAITGLVQLFFNVGSALSVGDLCGTLSAVGELGVQGKQRVIDAIGELKKELADDEEKAAIDAVVALSSAVNGQRTDPTTMSDGPGVPRSESAIEGVLSKFTKLGGVISKILKRFKPLELLDYLISKVDNDEYVAFLVKDEGALRLSEIVKWFGLPPLIRGGSNREEIAEKARESLVRFFKSVKKFLFVLPKSGGTLRWLVENLKDNLGSPGELVNVLEFTTTKKLPELTGYFSDLQQAVDELTHSMPPNVFGSATFKMVLTSLKDQAKQLEKGSKYLEEVGECFVAFPKAVSTQMLATVKEIKLKLTSKQAPLLEDFSSLTQLGRDYPECAAKVDSFAKSHVPLAIRQTIIGAVSVFHTFPTLGSQLAKPVQTVGAILAAMETMFEHNESEERFEKQVDLVRGQLQTLMLSLEDLASTGKQLGKHIFDLDLPLPVKGKVLDMVAFTMSVLRFVTRTGKLQAERSQPDAMVCAGFDKPLHFEQHPLLSKKDMSLVSGLYITVAIGGFPFTLEASVLGSFHLESETGKCEMGDSEYSAVTLGVRGQLDVRVSAGFGTRKVSVGPFARVGVFGVIVAIQADLDPMTGYGAVALSPVIQSMSGQAGLYMKLPMLPMWEWTMYAWNGASRRLSGLCRHQSNEFNPCSNYVPSSTRQDEGSNLVLPRGHGADPIFRPKKLHQCISCQYDRDGSRHGFNGWWGSVRATFSSGKVNRWACALPPARYAQLAGLPNMVDRVDLRSPHGVVTGNKNWWFGSTKLPGDREDVNVLVICGEEVDDTTSVLSYSAVFAIRWNDKSVPDSYFRVSMPASKKGPLKAMVSAQDWGSEELKSLPSRYKSLYNRELASLDATEMYPGGRRLPRVGSTVSFYPPVEVRREYLKRGRDDMGVPLDPQESLSISSFRHDDAGGSSLRSVKEKMLFGLDGRFATTKLSSFARSTDQCFECNWLLDDDLSDVTEEKLGLVQSTESRRLTLTLNRIEGFTHRERPELPSRDRLVCPMLGRRKSLVGGQVGKADVAFGADRCLRTAYMQDESLSMDLRETTVLVCLETVVPECATCGRNWNHYQGWLLLGRREERGSEEDNGDTVAPRRVTALQFSLNLKGGKEETTSDSTYVSFDDDDSTKSGEPLKPKTTDAQDGVRSYPILTHEEPGPLSDAMQDHTPPSTPRDEATQQSLEEQFCQATVFYDKLMHDTDNYREEHPYPHLEPVLLQLFEAHEQTKDRIVRETAPCIPSPYITDKHREQSDFNVLGPFEDTPMVKRLDRGNGDSGDLLRVRVRSISASDELEGLSFESNGGNDVLMTTRLSTGKCFWCYPPMDEDNPGWTCGSSQDQKVRQSSLRLDDDARGMLDVMVTELITSYLRQYDGKWAVCDESVFYSQNSSSQTLSELDDAKDAELAAGVMCYYEEDKYQRRCWRYATPFKHVINKGSWLFWRNKKDSEHRVYLQEVERSFGDAENEGLGGYLYFFDQMIAHYEYSSPQVDVTMEGQCSRQMPQLDGT